ncbi:MAG: MATE family Na+-driven efflux transporter [Acholeplasmataceae bacterium]
MTKIKNSLKTINYKMFFALLMFGLIPTLYMTVRIYLIGQLPNTYSFSIAGQLQWVSLFYEVLQEALILPLFYFIGAVLTNREALINRIRSGLLFTFIAYTTLSFLIILFARPLVVFMAQDSSIVTETVNYIRLETISMIFSTLVKYLIVVLVTLKRDKNLYILLIVQLVLTIIFDFFFMSTYSFSLNLGVNGMPITNMIVNLLSFVVLIVILYKNDLPILNSFKLDFSWFKELFKKGGLSGLESLIRNVAFMLMIVRMVNVVGEQGTFWVANNFIWGWLLLPVLQLGELIKSDCAEEKFIAVKNKSLGYFNLTLIFIILWGVTLPLWEPFMKHVLQISNYKDVLYIVLISVGFYVLFAINNVVDSIFYGLGKINLMLLQSIVVNSIYYGTAFILFQLGVFQPNLTLIALMFAIGTAFDSILTMVLYFIMLKKENINIFDFEIAM